MPIAILRPNGAGDLADWTPLNASGAPLANWASVSSGSPNQWVTAALSGLRDRYAFENLPADATGVTTVTLFALCAGDGLSAMRIVPRLAGTDDLSAASFMPLEGGYQLFSAAFATAPGSLAWTVARWNAIQAGFDALSTVQDPATPLQVDELWASVVYESALPDTERDALDVRFPDTSHAIAFPPRDPLDITFPVRIERAVTFRRD